jgi:hypothetical protein
MQTPKEPTKYETEGYARSQIMSIRASSQWRHWLHCRAAEEGVSQAEMIDEIIADWVRRNKKPVPPRRWPPEVGP